MTEDDVQKGKAAIPPLDGDSEPGFTASLEKENMTGIL